jgi:hypothetical protein
MIEAGEKGVTQKTLEEVCRSGREMIKRLHKEDVSWKAALLMPSDGKHYRVASGW